MRGRGLQRKEEGRTRGGGRRGEGWAAGGSLNEEFVCGNPRSQSGSEPFLEKAGEVAAEDLACAAAEWRGRGVAARLQIVMTGKTICDHTSTG